MATPKKAPIKSFTKIPAAKKVAATIAGMNMKAPKQKVPSFKGAAQGQKMPKVGSYKAVSTNGGSRPSKQSLGKNSIFNGLK